MATIKLSNIKEIEKYVNQNVISENIIIKALDKIALQVKGDLYTLVKERLYDAWTPSMYQRTEELLNSISKTEVYKDGNKYCVKIYYDTDKILPYSYNDKWGQHADFSGNSVVEYIPLWIEKGTSGSNNPFHRKGINCIEDLKEWLNDNFTELFSKKLKEYGINNY